MFLSALAPRTARATGAIEFPDNGSEQEGRGGAWVARASDPLATFYNPAGLAGQPTRLTLQSNISNQHTCFTRVKAASDITNDGVAAGATYPQICNNNSWFPDPQLAFTYRLTDRIGLGIALLGPSAVGNVSWPDFQGSAAAPQRYMLVSSNVALLTPTIGIGWEALDGLRLGASFIAGTAPSLDFVNAAVVVANSDASPGSNDVRNELKAKDLFIPGFTLGAIWSPADNLDIAGWYKWMAPIDATGDVTTAFPYYVPNAKPAYGDTSQPYCYTLPSGQPAPPASQALCGNGNNGHVKIPLPMEAKLGFRYHQPRSVMPQDGHLRDPIAQDLFDVEADFTWANDSAFDYLEIHFPGDAQGNGILPANPNLPMVGVIPPNADVRHHFKDVFGVRVGGDFNVLPDQLALRAGAFYESPAVDPMYQNVDFDAAQRIGVALGGTYRLALGAEKRRALEIMAAYGHVFFATENNGAGNPNAQGLPALAGNAQPYRTSWPVNLGTITSDINVINVGASYKF
jgi:long-chain fatty acid transport protein